MIPLILSLKNKEVLIVGGGPVALRKARQYLSEGANVTVLSLDFKADFWSLPLKLCQEAYSLEALKGKFMVYAATNQKALNQTIVEDCARENILCGSATKDENASFYSMAFRELPQATLALSTHQKLPYTKPLLDELTTLLESKAEVLEIMGNLRPELLCLGLDVKSYIDKLYACDLAFLKFLEASLKAKKGYLFVYHPTQKEEKFALPLEPAIALSIPTFEKNQDLLVFPIEYHVIPLLINDGIIYQRLKAGMKSNLICHSPLISNEKMLGQVLKPFLHVGRKLLCIIHPRQNKLLKQQLQEQLKNQGEVYDLNETVILDKTQKYDLVLFLMTQGKHYEEYYQKFLVWQKEGYDIHFEGILSKSPKVMSLYQEMMKE